MEAMMCIRIDRDGAAFPIRHPKKQIDSYKKHKDMTI